jgi:hypothetical protein
MGAGQMLSVVIWRDQKEIIIHPEFLNPINQTTTNQLFK